MARYFVILILLLLLILFSSCEQPYGDVIMGNHDYRRGDFQQAIVHYLSVSSHPQYKEWITYNLGNVFYMLGEYPSALEEWKNSETAKSERLLFHLYFNKGVLYYQRGEYTNSSREFRKALTFIPTNQEAKINLEYALRKVHMKIKPPAQTETVADDQEKPHDKTTSHILEYVRRNETLRRPAAGGEQAMEGVKDW